MLTFKYSTVTLKESKNLRLTKYLQTKNNLKSITQTALTYKYY